MLGLWSDGWSDRHGRDAVISRNPNITPRQGLGHSQFVVRYLGSFQLVVAFGNIAVADDTEFFVLRKLAPVVSDVLKREDLHGFTGYYGKENSST
jgi:hypothetical protein